MKEFKLKLHYPFNEVIVTITQKNIKNIHLKVFRNLKIELSVPAEVPEKWISDFLTSKTDWIEKQLLKYKNSSGYNNLADIKNGSSTQIFGKDCRIILKESNNNYVEENEKNIIVYTSDNNFQKLFNEWWRNKAINTYKSEMNDLYKKIFKKYNIPAPSLQVRKMKTLWGSCTPSKNKITINEYLLKAEPRCIRYVILHELTHLLYPYHNKDFYTFLTIQMPDWQEVKKQLDLEVVQGL